MAAESSGGFVRDRIERATSWWTDDVTHQWAVAAGVVAFVVFRFLVDAPFAILFQGIVLGSLSALVAMGLVLVYRANRIINFAQGQMGGLAAVLAASLIVGPKWSFFPAVAVGFLAALVLGALTEILFIRRFAKAPRLLLTVATIGILQLFAFGQLGLPRLFDFDTAPQPPVPFDLTFNLNGTTFSAGHILILMVVPVVAVALSAFFRFTRIGIAVRASAESADRAALLGVPVKRIGTLVWIISAGLSGLGVLLRMPIQGVNIGGFEGSSLLLRALAAAVIGRMESMPKAFAAALALGMVEQAVLYDTGRTVVVDGILFFVIVAGLLLQRRRSESRADDIGASSWAATREVRPVPRELTRLPEVNAARVVGGVLMVLGLVFLPLTLSQGNVGYMEIALMMGMVTLSLVILTGWAGQISLGQLAFMAFGAAVSGTLAQHNVNFFLCIALGSLTGAVVAVIVGLPALRIRGLFLAVTTLAFALTTGTFFLNREFFPWIVPVPGTYTKRPVLFDKFDLASERAMYYVILVFFAFTLASVRSLRRSRTGRILVAVRDNERAAQSYAVNPIRAKLSAFALSGFFAAMAGSLYFFYFQTGRLSSTLLDPESSLRIFSMAVIGGLGSIPGALLGAAYLTFVDYSPFTKEPLSRLFASGVGVLFILMFIPAGLGSVLYGIRDSLLRVIARRRGIVVPSLLADVLVEDDALVDRSAPTEAIPVVSDAVQNPLLLIRDLDAGYGKTQVLFGVDMHVERGEIVALLGTNGAGKSTLLSVISGLLEPSAGSLIFDGNDIAGRAPQDTLAAGVVFMPGGKGVFPTLTVEENFKLAAWCYQKEPDYVAAMFERCFGYFPVLKDRWDQKAGNLSGGEQQMLTLSQALISKPKLLMIDELSLGLAPLIVEQLLGIVREIHATGTTIVLVEQSVNVAITLAQRAIFMEKGEVRFEGRTADLLERPDILRAVFLQGADAGRASVDGDQLKIAAKARKTFVPLCRTCGHEHVEAMAVTEVGVSFGGVRAVDGVSLAVRQSEVVGIIGPNGSGKTTLFDVMSGFVTPTEGRVDLLGEDVTAWTPDMRAEAGLGRSFQDARLFPSMTVRQTIAVALERHLDVRDPFAAAVISPAVRISERAVAAEVDDLIELMHLEAFADKFVGELSTGTRRIVDIACSLAHRPAVLLLDEPSSGIAQREAEALAPLLLSIRDTTGAALVVIEHDMPLIRSVSDRLVALELGQVVAEGDPDKVIHDPRVVEGYLGGTLEVIERSGMVARPGAGRAPTKKAAAKKATTKKVAAKKVAANGTTNGAAKKVRARV